MTAKTTPQNVSPFVTYRDMIMGDGDDATTLQDLVLSMWKGSDFTITSSTKS